MPKISAAKQRSNRSELLQGDGDLVRCRTKNNPRTARRRGIENNKKLRVGKRIR
jgi:hypothetical protein